ncbi:MAG TPA: rod shape-determining protein [Candidatus Paceibacterota bacterium]|jgi:rod shape-determining protein MreB|nr:rod shape-determining protein [Candidatus Paceibacterota bacterium]
MSLFGNVFKDIGIDLGTANCLIYLKGKGIVINEPSVAAVNTKTNHILAVGDEAKKMLGRTPPHINVVRPLVNGVISDFEMTEELLRHFLRRPETSLMGSYRRAILAIPDNLTEVERKSVEDAALNAGCSKVYLVESPIVAALGASLPIKAPTASMIVDIGGGTTDIAVIAMGGTVTSRTLKIAGDRFNEEIIRFARDEFHLAIGEPTAEYAKITVGSAMPLDERLEVPVRGRDMGTGLPREIGMKNNHVRAALAKSLRSIVDSVREVIEETPPELAGDVLREGITMCGGGALLRGFNELLEKETGVPVRVADDPLTCVARGLGLMVDDFESNKELLDNPLKPLSINL